MHALRYSQRMLCVTPNACFVSLPTHALCHSQCVLIGKGVFPEAGRVSSPRREVRLPRGREGVFPEAGRVPSSRREGCLPCAFTPSVRREGHLPPSDRGTKKAGHASQQTRPNHEKIFVTSPPDESRGGARLCLVIRERLGAEALDEAADPSDLRGAVADIDAGRGRERVVRVGALEE